jgi:hypothetical protein
MVENEQISIVVHGLIASRRKHSGDDARWRRLIVDQ